jgi:GNAT superfamily N-acetyltransferase
MLTVRRAESSDAALLQEMLVVAADWRPGSRICGVLAIMEEPSLSHYIDGWPKKGDAGFVAEQEESIGAAWWRFFSAEDPGYGFVKDEMPEVSIGVREGFRRQGVGILLLAALIDEARRQQLRALSLSVEADNPATALYERLGFAALDRDRGSVTMLLSLVE